MCSFGQAAQHQLKSLHMEGDEVPEVEHAKLAAPPVLPWGDRVAAPEASMEAEETLPATEEEVKNYGKLFEDVADTLPETHADSLGDGALEVSSTSDPYMDLSTTISPVQADAEES